MGAGGLDLEYYFPTKYSDAVTGLIWFLPMDFIKIVIGWFARGGVKISMHRGIVIVCYFHFLSNRFSQKKHPKRKDHRVLQIESTPMVFHSRMSLELQGRPSMREEQQEIASSSKSSSVAESEASDSKADQAEARAQSSLDKAT